MVDPRPGDVVDGWRLELSLEAKNGVNFIVAAALVWAGVAVIWTTSFSAYHRSIMTFVAASLLLPLAFALSKLFGAKWSVERNPIEPLGLWLNFAQLCYFPFLVFVLLVWLLCATERPPRSRMPRRDSEIA